MKSARAVEDEINLNAFYKEFIRPGRGSANVIAGAADPTTKRAWLVSSPGSRQTATVTAARKAE